MAESDDARKSRPTVFVGASGTNALAYMLSGLLMGAFAGWLGRRFLHTDLLFIPALLGGLALGWYTIWVRYGQLDRSDLADDEETQ